MDGEEIRTPARAPALSLGTADLIAFVPTKDKGRAPPFYEKTLRVPMEGESLVACAFRAGCVLLRVIVVEQLTPFAFTLLGWSVDDITDTGARGRPHGQRRRVARRGPAQRLGQGAAYLTVKSLRIPLV